MKQVNISCPYCGAKAVRRSAQVVRRNQRSAEPPERNGGTLVPARRSMSAPDIRSVMPMWPPIGTAACLWEHWRTGNSDRCAGMPILP